VRFIRVCVCAEELSFCMKPRLLVLKLTFPHSWNLYHYESYDSLTRTNSHAEVKTLTFDISEHHLTLSTLIVAAPFRRQSAYFSILTSKLSLKQHLKVPISLLLLTVNGSEDEVVTFHLFSFVCPFFNEPQQLTGESTCLKHTKTRFTSKPKAT